MTVRMWLNEMIKYRERRKKDFIDNELFNDVIRMDNEIEMIRIIYEGLNQTGILDMQKK